MSTATIHDISERRKQTRFVQVKDDMTPHQWNRRQTMERGDWKFKKVIKSGDVVMTFGTPIKQMAFIEPAGNVEHYEYDEEG